MSPHRSVVPRLFIQTAVWLAISGALLFIPAGTFRWPEAWIYIAGIGTIGLVSAMAIARRDPELLRERMRAPVQRDQKGWDKILLSLFMALSFAQYIVCGLDHRFAASDVPLWVKGAGAGGVALGFYVFHVVLRANTFAAPVVKIQSERKHRVIDTGPYAYVRHPMYAGFIPMSLGTPLLLGSWYGFALAFLLIAIMSVRAVLEENTLKAELEGYEAYAARVRYRLVPGVW
jgi:protein-S-isoprenylcysteine O-methyltransferase Ste14